MTKKSAEDDPRQEQADQYREYLANAVDFVRGQAATQTVAAITPEDLLGLFIERASGKDTQARPNTLNRYKKIKDEVMQTIEKIKAMPEDAFRSPDQSADVNTRSVVVDFDIQGNE